MDRNIIAIGHAYADQEAAVAVACYSAAAYHGLSNMQADSCEDGSQACPTCPFNDKPIATARPKQINCFFASGALKAMPGMSDSRRSWVIDQPTTNGVAGK